MKAIDQSTIKAYKETDYCVSSEPPIILRVGAANESLAKLYKQSKIRSGTLITACNPFSQDVGEIINAARQAELAKDLSQRSLTFFEGIGKHPSGDWNGEPSYFVLGLSLEAAKALAACLASR